MFNFNNLKHKKRRIFLYKSIWAFFKGFDFWWFKGKNDLIKIIIKNLGSHNNKVLNVGCGIGEDLGILSQYTDLIGRHLLMDVNV